MLFRSDIPYYIRKALDAYYSGQRITEEEQIYEIDAKVRTFVQDLIDKR